MFVWSLVFNFEHILNVMSNDVVPKRRPVQSLYSRQASGSYSSCGTIKCAAVQVPQSSVQIYAINFVKNKDDSYWVNSIFFIQLGTKLP
jgi:hypothetical protein